MKTFLIKIFIFFPLTIFAQQDFLIPDSASLTNALRTKVSSNQNSANLLSQFRWENIIGSYKINISETYNSDVTKLGNNFFRNYNNLKAIASYNLLKNLYVGSGIQSRIISDEKQIEINKDRNDFYFVNLEYTRSNFFIDSKLGYRIQDQIGIQDDGISAALSSQIKDLEILRFRTNSTISLLLDNLSEKSNYNYAFSTTIDKNFSDKTSNRTKVQVSFLRNDFYIPATTSIISQYGVNNNIQMRNDNIAWVENELKYDISKAFLFTTYASIQLRDIKNRYKYIPPASNIIFDNIYNTYITDNSYKIGITLDAVLKQFSSILNLQYSERNEQHSAYEIQGLSQQQMSEIQKIEISKNNLSRITSLVFETQYSVSNTNFFKGSISSLILRYDTESKDNLDDRDELYVTAQITHRYDNLLNFIAETSFEFNSVTLNYLFKERSANNNTNKIYKLTSKTFYSPFNFFTTKNLFQVLANYTVYQYEDLVSQIQSFSFRQFLFNDSTHLKLNTRIFLDFTGNLRIYEQGVYNDKNFTVKPINYYDERTIQSEIGYFISDLFIVSLGVRHFIQRYYNYDKGTKYLRRTYVNYGPLVEIKLSLFNNSSLNLKTGIDYVESSTEPDKTSSVNLILNLLYNF
ncbi:MAG: hypothetical protein ACP5P3_10000 [Ignavibacteria bacterium]